MNDVNERVRTIMSSDHKYPCVYGCGNEVIAESMPKVTCCKACYVKLRKEKPDVASRLQTWAEFLSGD